ncbi:hypothetical protein DXG01_014277, partial [Tephrocybe rancida]
MAHLPLPSPTRPSSTAPRLLSQRTESMVDLPSSSPARSSSQCSSYCGNQLHAAQREEEKQLARALLLGVEELRDHKRRKTSPDTEGPELSHETTLEAEPTPEMLIKRLQLRCDALLKQRDAALMERNAARQLLKRLR